MDDADLLGSIFKEASERTKANRRTTEDQVSLDDDISDITFMLHWFPQYRLEELLDMPLRTFNALLRHAKADYLQEHLQDLIGISAVNSEGKKAQEYGDRLLSEIKRLRD